MKNKHRNVGKVRRKVTTIGGPQRGRPDSSLSEVCHPSNNCTKVKSVRKSLHKDNPPKITKREYDKIEKKIQKLVDEQCHDEMKKYDLSIAILPRELGETLIKLQKEIVDWYETHKK